MAGRRHGHRARASMGPGRKPRKEPGGTGAAPSPSAGFNGAWAKTKEGTAIRRATRTPGQSGLQWGLGENPGRKPAVEGHRPHLRHASMGPGRKPRKERPGAGRVSLIAYRLQWGLGENPGRNLGEAVARGESVEASMGPGRKPRKEHLKALPSLTGGSMLQWGLGENPGRNGAGR